MVFVCYLLLREANINIKLIFFFIVILTLFHMRGADSTGALTVISKDMDLKFGMLK